MPTKLPLISCEPLLYDMMEEGGIDMSVFGVQSSVISMLDFENPHDRGFGPNHGIHFGLFRVDPADMDKDVTIQLDHKAYQYYIEIFRKEILPDPLFRKLYTMFPEKLKMYFHRFFQYYCLETNGIAE